MLSKDRQRTRFGGDSGMTVGSGNNITTGHTMTERNTLDTEVDVSKYGGDTPCDSEGRTARVPSPPLSFYPMCQQAITVDQVKCCCTLVGRVSHNNPLESKQLDMWFIGYALPCC